MFEDDENIKRYLILVDEFIDLQMDLEGKQDWKLFNKGDKDPISLDLLQRYKVIQLKTNFFLKGWIPLWRLFNINDVPTKSSLKPEPSKVLEFNLGTPKDPIMVKVSNNIFKK